jgi:hypothetical protein
MAGAVTLNMPPARGEAKIEAQRFAARLEAASNESIVGGRPLRIEISQAGYSFARYVRGEWLTAEPPSALSPRSFSGVLVTVEMEDPALLNERPSEDEAQPETRRLVLDAIGATAPFTVDFADRRERWRVVRSADGAIEVTQSAHS